MTDYQEYLDFLYSALESHNKQNLELSESTALVADIGLSSLEVMEFIENKFENKTKSFIQTGECRPRLLRGTQPFYGAMFRFAWLAQKRNRRLFCDPRHAVVELDVGQDGVHPP